VKVSSRPDLLSLRPRYRGRSSEDAQESDGLDVEEYQAVAEECFVDWRRPGGGGSHVIFSAPGEREIVPVPAKRPIKPVYIKQFVALIDAAGGIRKK